MSFRSTMDRMRSVVRSDLESIDDVQSKLNAYLTLFSPVAITIAVGIAPSFDGPVKFCLWTLFGVLSIFHFVLWYWLREIRGPAKSAALALDLQACHDMEIDALQKIICEKEKEIMSIDGNIQIASLYLSYSDIWNATIAQAISHELFDDTALHVATAAIFTPIRISMEKLFGIHEGEQWCLTFYMQSKEENLLKCVWGSRAPIIDDGTPHRDIPIGSGHIGLAFYRGETLIHDDMQNPSINKIVSLNDSHRKDYDASRFRAFASYPVRFFGESKVLGVVAVTSNVPGRFTEANTVPIRMATTYAGMLIHLANHPISP